MHKFIIELFINNLNNQFGLSNSLSRFRILVISNIYLHYQFY